MFQELLKQEKSVKTYTFLEWKFIAHHYLRYFDNMVDIENRKLQNVNFDLFFGIVVRKLMNKLNNYKINLETNFHHFPIIVHSFFDSV